MNSKFKKIFSLKYFTSFVAIIMSSYILFAAIKTPLPAIRERSLVLMLSLFIAFILNPTKGEKAGKIDIIIALIAAISCGYVFYNFDSIILRMGRPTNLDKIFGFLTIFLVLEATRRSIGLPLAAIAALFLAYSRWGYIVPGLFTNRGYSINRIITQQFMTAEGVFGVPVGVIVSIVFLFILFGTFLEQSGGGEFFINFAVAIAGKFRGGPAKIAIIASALMGMINGSSLANVATTGAFTIPLMKKTGYAPHFAGAVEATASTGGQLMPPIMGAAAFIMAEFTNIPYLTIIMAAIIPAILYFFSIFMNVHFEACRENLEGMDKKDIPALKSVLKDGYIYVIPIVSLVVVLVRGYSPARAAIIGISLLIIASIFKPEKRMYPTKIIKALEQAGKTTVPIMVACGSAGMIVGVVTQTALGLKFTRFISILGGDNLLLALLFTAIASIILGMALPTTAKYIVVSAIAAPALTNLGVSLIAAHLFIFYFAVYADITPPVGLAAYTGAGIAGAEPLLTGLTAARNVTVGYIVPFLFVYFPTLIGHGNIVNIILDVATALIAIICISSFFSNYLIRKFKILERIIIGIAGIMILLPFVEFWQLNLIGLILLVFIIYKQKPEKHSIISLITERGD